MMPKFHLSKTKPAINGAIILSTEAMENKILNCLPRFFLSDNRALSVWKGIQNKLRIPMMASQAKMVYKTGLLGKK